MAEYRLQNDTSGSNTPPPYGATGMAYLVGSSPTGAWTGHAGEIAVNNGKGPGAEGYTFIGQTAMKEHIYWVGPWPYKYNGVYMGVIYAQNDFTAAGQAIVATAPPAAVDGTYHLTCVVSGTGTVFTYAWVAYP